MSRVHFLNSVGLAVLVGAHDELPWAQRMALASVPSRMRRMLRVAGLPASLLVHHCDEPWQWPQLFTPLGHGLGLR